MVGAVWRFAVGVLSVGLPGLALAADLQPAPPAPPEPAAAAPVTYTSAAPEWTVTIGVEGRALPAWPGAPNSQYGFAGWPLLSLRRAGTPPEFFGARDSFSFSVIDLGMFRFGPAAKLIWHRDASSYKELAGLNDVDYAVQVGGFGEFWPVPWLRLRGEVRQGLGGETGVTGDAFLDAVVPFGSFRWSAGPRLTVQSAAAIGPYFNVTSAEAANTAALAPSTGEPALPLYTAKGGLYSYGAGTQLEYFVSPQWAAHALFEYERLTASAANSPIVTLRGSPNQFTFGLGATYSFNIRQFW